MEYCIGVDLGGTNIAVGIVDLSSKTIVVKKSIKTNAPRSCELISRDIVELCNSLAADKGVTLKDMKWIGIATPGIVKDGVVISASNLGWVNADFAGIMSSMTGLPVFVANDANSAAYAEAVWGVGEGAHSLVIVTLGTGIGGGIVIDGKIWEGNNGFAAEIGHMIIDTDGRICTCGKRGCFESYSSARALVFESRRMMGLYKDSLMWNLVGGDINRVNGITPFAAAKHGDPAARAVIDDYVKYLAVGISNVINIFQPDVVCIGGGVSGEGDALMLPLRDKIEKISFGTAKSKTTVCVAKYMNDAGIVGSALLGMQGE